MKANKAPDAGIEVSPSQKKLKQARLPFKLISEATAVSDSPNSRKRKLSAQENETASKIGKISKENGNQDDLVVISDDECKDAPKTKISTMTPNPFVKLIDTAIKKKLQKTKTPKKKKNNKKKETVIYDCVEVENSPDCMDVDESIEAVSTENNNKITSNAVTDTAISDENSELQSTESTKDKIGNSKTTPQSTETPEVNISDPEPSNSCKTTLKTEDAIIDLDDSNNSNDVQTIGTKTVTKNNECKTTEKSEKTETTVENNIESPPNITPVTPKRSSRLKASKSDEKSSLDLSMSSTKDESMTSNPNTPKQKRNTSIGANGEELNESNKSLTPKQLHKKLESSKKREEREKEKQERDKKRQQEKEERDRVKKEKEDQKKKEREEKEEAKRKEREEKEKQKEQEKKLREEKEEQRKKEKEEKEEQKKKEREEKEEQRKKEKEAREEEKRKRQEALDLEKQEQELKKKKAAEAFANFFVPKQKNDKDQACTGPIIQNNMLSSFTIKSDMRLAPTVRQEFTEDRRKTLDGSLKEQGAKDLYLNCLKNGVKPASGGKTWPLSDKNDDVMIIEDDLPTLDDVGEVITCESAVREKLKPKLFSFHENRRPPYWGTWRKKSAAVKPRRPFGQDEKLLDYEVDSDDEWEEEAEGESLDGSAAGSDTEPADDDYEVDNELFVPHGYLSDEEATMDEDDRDILSLSPETQKARLKHLEDEFESEMKKPTEKLKPRLYGLIWETSDGGRPEKCVDALWNYFGKLAMIMDDPTLLLQPAPENEDAEKKKARKKKLPESEQASPKSEKKKKTKSEKPKPEPKMSIPEVKKSQLGINSFLTKLKTT